MDSRQDPTGPAVGAADRAAAHAETYAAEADSRWGGTPAYAESQRRTRSYGPAEWAQIEADGRAVNDDLAALRARGLPAADPSVTATAERHRRMIDRWFYPCSYDMHEALGEMYVDDPRFTAHYDQVQPGLAEYLRDSIRANATRGRTSG